MKSINIAGVTYHVGDKVFLKDITQPKPSYADAIIYTISKITQAGYVYLQHDHEKRRIDSNGFDTENRWDKNHQMMMVTDDVRTLAQQKQFIKETFDLMKNTTRLSYAQARQIRAVLKRNNK